MPGIWGAVFKKETELKIDLSNAFYKEPGVTYLVDHTKFLKAVFGRHSVNKFNNDKTFKLLDLTLVSNDGVIFNLKDLLEKNNSKDITNLFLKLYKCNGWNFVENLRGNFAGLIYESTENRLILYTDHLASKPVYYFHDKDSNILIFSSELKVVATGMKTIGFTPHLDIRGAYNLLTLGYMLGDITLIKEIHKLPPGTVLLYDNGELILKEYYKLSSKPYIEDAEEEILKELDRRFSYAVKLEYEKDLEYGYSHIATLSGGLDSRTNIAYAKTMGFNEITCFTFSQNDYLDEKVAKEICSDNHLEFIFYSLNNGDYLTNKIDEIISSNDGLVLYSGSAHLYNCLRKLSFQDIGLVHTGLIGDLVLGSYLQKTMHTSVDDHILNKISYSNKLIKKLKNIVELNHLDYENDEMFAFYERCVNGVFNGYRMIEQFTEFSSPFLYIDFFDYAMRIHPKYRYKEAIYLKWINKYKPQFSKHIWEKYGLPPKYPLFLLKMYSKSRFLFRMVTGGFNKKYISMNPTEFWWSSNGALQDNIKSIFNENIKTIDNPDLLNDCNYLFNEGSLIEKTQVITLLKAMEMLAIKDEK